MCVAKIVWHIFATSILPQLCEAGEEGRTSLNNGCQRSVTQLLCHQSSQFLATRVKLSGWTGTIFFLFCIDSCYKLSWHWFKGACYPPKRMHSFEGRAQHFLGVYWIFISNPKENLLGFTDLSVSLAIPSRGGNAAVMLRPQARRALRNIVDVSSSFSFPRKSDCFTWEDHLLYHVLFWWKVGWHCSSKVCTGSASIRKYLTGQFVYCTKISITA